MLPPYAGILSGRKKKRTPETEQKGAVMTPLLVDWGLFDTDEEAVNGLSTLMDVDFQFVAVFVL